MAKLKVNILGLSCSYKKGGETARLVQYALKETEDFGRRIAEIGDLETEFVDMADKEVKPFSGYYQWTGNRVSPPRRSLGVPGDFGCVEEEDDMQKLWPKIAEADGFVFGSPVSVGSASSKFRILCERLTAKVGRGILTNKPAGLIAVGYGPIGGHESCLRHMAHCIRELEMIEVSWMLGAPVAIDPDFASGKPAGVEADQHGRRLAALSARRVVEFAVMQKLARLELGDLYTKEFMQVYHDARPEETWFWDRLDKEDEEGLMALEGSRRGEKAWITSK